MPRIVRIETTRKPDAVDLPPEREDGEAADHAGGSPHRVLDEEPEEGGRRQQGRQRIVPPRARTPRRRERSGEERREDDDRTRSQAIRDGGAGRARGPPGRRSTSPRSDAEKNAKRPTKNHRREREERDQRGDAGGEADEAVRVAPFREERDAGDGLEQRQRDRRGSSVAPRQATRRRRRRTRPWRAGPRDQLEVRRPGRRRLGRRRRNPGRGEGGGPAPADPLLVVLELVPALRAMDLPLVRGYIDLGCAGGAAMGGDGEHARGAAAPGAGGKLRGASAFRSGDNSRSRRLPALAAIVTPPTGMTCGNK